jgi:membrane associated rhomboid family serine protease
VFPLRDINPTRTRPVVNWLLIALNGVFFLYELSLGPRLDDFLATFAFVPARLFEAHDVTGSLVTALVSMFLHGGWAHILGNMLFLWVFGDNVEDRLGHGRYVLFYLLSGLAATLGHALAEPHSRMPAIGASGAISGVLGAYVFMYPRARVVTAVVLIIFVRIVELPALVYLPLWFAMQLFSGIASVRHAATTGGGGVAWFAHIGGFLAGPLLALLLGGFRRRTSASSYG